MAKDRIKLETLPSDNPNSFSIRATYAPDYGLIAGIASQFTRDLEEKRVVFIRREDDSKDGAISS